MRSSQLDPAVPLAVRMLPSARALSYLRHFSHCGGSRRMNLSERQCRIWWPPANSCLQMVGGLRCSLPTGQQCKYLLIMFGFCCKCCNCLALYSPRFLSACCACLLRFCTPLARMFQHNISFTSMMKAACTSTGEQWSVVSCFCASCPTHTHTHVLKLCSCLVALLLCVFFSLPCVQHL